MYAEPNYVQNHVIQKDGFQHTQKCSQYNLAFQSKSYKLDHLHGVLEIMLVTCVIGERAHRPTSTILRQNLNGITGLGDTLSQIGTRGVFCFAVIIFDMGLTLRYIRKRVVCSFVVVQNG